MQPAFTEVEAQHVRNACVDARLTCDLKHIPKLWWNFYAKDTVAYSADVRRGASTTGPHTAIYHYSVVEDLDCY